MTATDEVKNPQAAENGFGCGGPLPAAQTKACAWGGSRRCKWSPFNSWMMVVYTYTYCCATAGILSAIERVDDDDVRNGTRAMNYDGADADQAAAADGRGMNWKFWRTFLFLLNSYSTLGYGNMYPVTSGGMVATTIFCLIGIPLYFKTISKLGRTFVRWYKLILIGVLRLAGVTIDRAAEMGSEDYVCFPCSKTKTVQNGGGGAAGCDNLGTTNTVGEQKPKRISFAVRFLPLVAWFAIYFVIVAATFVSQLAYQKAKAKRSARSKTSQRTAAAKEKNVTFGDAVFYTFVGMSTIGYGAVFPQTDAGFALSSILIALGMAFIAMFIHLAEDCPSCCCGKKSCGEAKVDGKC